MNKSNRLEDQHVSVESFSGATIRSIKHFIQPTLEENQPNFITCKNQRSLFSQKCDKSHAASGHMQKIKGQCYCF